MGRLQRGFRLALASWDVLRGDRSLVWLPVVSTAAILVFAAAIMAPAYASGMQASNRPELFLLLAVTYFASNLIATFFNAAIVAAATDRMNGGAGRPRDGLRTAWSRIGPLVLWAALSATVGLVLRAVEQRAGFVGVILTRVIGAAWSVVTFLVVPILVFEPVGPVNAVKRSGGLFRQVWGEQLVGNGSISLAVFVIAIPVLVLCIVVGAVSVPLAIAVGVAAFVVLLAVGSALSGIFNAALYRYASSGQAMGPFVVDDLQGSFRPRRPRTDRLD
jgi:hypothetical protein